jgi:hypothetical protein
MAVAAQHPMGDYTTAQHYGYNSMRFLAQRRGFLLPKIVHKTMGK